MWRAHQNQQYQLIFLSLILHCFCFHWIEFGLKHCIWSKKNDRSEKKKKVSNIVYDPRNNWKSEKKTSWIRKKTTDFIWIALFFFIPPLRKTRTNFCTEVCFFLKKNKLLCRSLFLTLSYRLLLGHLDYIYVYIYA